MKLRSDQRGAAALAVAMVLLFGMTLIAFFANRTMIFEQRTSANQYRATKAFEMADAGIEWATARLNDSSTLAANSCVPNSAGPESFRGRYARPMPADASHATGWFQVSGTAAYPGCQIDPATGLLACDCPSAGAATLASTSSPRFRVRFNALADPTTVEVISRGCTNGDPCDPPPQVASAATDATAVVRVVFKIVPTFPGGGPKAGLVSGSTTVATGSLNVVNTDTRSNGITINTGSNVVLESGSGLSVVSLPGTPPAASILDNDPSLLKLTHADSTGELFFSSFLGMGFDDFKTSPLTKRINGISSASFNASSSPLTCSGGNDCGKAVSHWIDQGFTQFWVDLLPSDSVTLVSGNRPSTTPGQTFGTELKPIVLATQGQMSFAGGITAYGVFYGATATALDDVTLGAGSATIYGSLISRGDFGKSGNGSFTIVPKSSLFGNPAPPNGLLIPVPGTWRDKATAY